MVVTKKMEVYMKAIIYHSMSKKRTCKELALKIEGDHYEINPTKRINTYFFQLLVYGFKTSAKKEVKYEKIDIDFSKYEEIVLVSPVWAGQVNAFMRQFLKDNPFHDKKVTIIGSCEGGYKNYFETYKGLIDGCCEIVEKQMYVKGVKQ